jgi:hypothetical protein
MLVCAALCKLAAVLQACAHVPDGFMLLYVAACSSSASCSTAPFPGSSTETYGEMAACWAASSVCMMLLDYQASIVSLLINISTFNTP